MMEMCNEVFLVYALCLEKCPPLNCE